MAHTKQKGSSKLGRDSQSKRLGVKIYGGQPAKAGSIIIRQRGTRFISGENTGKGVDDTIFATSAGMVQFESKTIKSVGKNFKKRKVVSIIK